MTSGKLSISTLFFLSARPFFPLALSVRFSALFIRGNPFHCEKSPSFQLLLFRFNSFTHTLNFTMNIQAITFETLAAVSCYSCRSSTRNVLGLDPESVHDNHSVPHSSGVDVAHQDNHSNLRMQLRHLRNGGQRIPAWHVQRLFQPADPAVPRSSKERGPE